MKLRLERRGMDFYNGCPEKNVGDLDNFRYFGEFIDNKGIHRYLEITTHWRDNVKRVNTFISMSYENKDGCFACGYITTEPNKAAILKGINDMFNTNFTEISLEDKI